LSDDVAEATMSSETRLESTCSIKGPASGCGYVANLFNLLLLERLVASPRAGVAFQRFFVVVFAALAVFLVAVFAAGLSTGVPVVVDSSVGFTVLGIGVAFAVLSAPTFCWCARPRLFLLTVALAVGNLRPITLLLVLALTLARNGVSIPPKSRCMLNICLGDLRFEFLCEFDLFRGAMVWIELPRLRWHRKKVLVFRRSKVLRDFRRSFGFRRDLSDIPVLRLSSSGLALLLLATKLFESLALIIRECAEFCRSVVNASLEVAFCWLALLGRRALSGFPSLLLLSGVLFQVNIVVASVDGHMADDQVRMSSKVARGTPKWRSS